MADLSKFKNQKYAYLNQLSTEKLEELLKMDRLSECDEATSEYFDTIEEVILRREEQDPSGRLSDVDNSWKEFQEQFATPEGKGIRLFPDEDDGDNSSNSTITPSDNQPVTHRHRSRILRKIAIVAAIATILLAGMVVAQAVGLDVFGRLAQWTNEIFFFESQSADLPSVEQESVRRSNEIYDALQAEVARCGISGLSIPSYFPDGYTLADISSNENDVSRGVFCALANENMDLLTIDFQKYADSDQVSSLAIEKDESPVEEYISDNGLRAYIMDNRETTVATWSWDDWCVTIDGSISETEMRMMIDSVGE